MTTQYGDWGRNGLMAMATRHLDWRLVEVVREIPGLGYSAAPQNIRRFWSPLPKDPRKERFRHGLLAKCQMSRSDPIASPIASAVLDRLLHHAETVVIEGPSYRMKDREPAPAS